MADANQLLDQARRAYDAGDYDAALTLSEQAIGLGRKNPGALQLLGLALFAQGKFDEAVNPLERCAALRPKEPAVHVILGRTHTNRAKYRAALDRFDKALKLDPGSLDAIGGKADVQYARGEHKKVLALLEPLAIRGAETPHMGLNLARSLSGLDRDDEAVGFITRHADAAEASLETRRQLRFLRGRIHERCREFDEAFAAFAAANRVEPGTYDADAYGRRVDDLIAVYSAENLAGLPRATHGLETPVLIVGMPRTGSTLLERILDAHPRARGAGETSALPQVVGGMSLTVGSGEPYPPCMRQLTEAAANEAGRSYVDRLEQIARGADRIVDKNLYNYENVGLISLICPGARVIDCRRNPLDTCLSCFTEALSPDGHPYASSLEGLGRRYRDYERLMDHWHRVTDGRLLTVTYEDLTAEPERVSRELIEFIGLKWDDRCLRFNESRFKTRTLSIEQVRKPIYRSSVNRSDRFRGHLDPLREALAGSR